jgi:nitroreductase
VMTAAAVMGLDTCPMEGLDPQKFDAILNLPSRGLKTSVALALGYRAADDHHAQRPKVRFEPKDVLLHL